MRQLKLTVPAGGALDIGAVGNYVRIKTALVVMRVDSPETGEFLEMEAGDAADLTPFKRLRISHEDGSDQTIVILVGNGTKATSGKIGGVVSLIGSSGAFTQANKTVTNASGLLLAANALRRTLIVQNNDAGGNIYLNIAGAAATIAGGLKVGPGGTLVLDVYAPIGEIYAIGDIASNANITAAEG